MFKTCILIFWGLSIISTVFGTGEFTILHHPQSLHFKGHEHLKQSILPEVYSAALGFSTQHFSNWPGMYIEIPFDLPEAIVTISVDGVADIGQQKGHHFPLKTDSTELEVFQTLERNILVHYPAQNPQLVRVDLSNGLEDLKKYNIFAGIHTENLKHITHKSLKLDVDEDRQFLKDIVLLHELAHKIEHKGVKKDGISDVFWFQLNSLHALSDLHGENSTEAVEAKQLLNEAIVRLNVAFTKVYDGSVLVNIITSDASHTRRSRSILQAAVAAEAQNDKTKYNLASYYNEDYPVIFNIILWFMITLLFSLIAICIAIGTMDPGRDSVIYRMTSTRMKKDN